MNYRKFFPYKETGFPRILCRTLTTGNSCLWPSQELNEKMLYTVLLLHPFRLYFFNKLFILFSSIIKQPPDFMGLMLLSHLCKSRATQLKSQTSAEIKLMESKIRNGSFICLRGKNNPGCNIFFARSPATEAAP